MAKWDNKKTDLMKAILTLRTTDEAKRFFRDLLTEQEIIECARRWQAAKMLSKNIPYTQVEKETGLSSTTVARASKWLNRGMKGYKLVLKRLNVHHHSQFSRNKRYKLKKRKLSKVE
jgi:TrpR-related protein YerC/YecD